MLALDVLQNGEGSPSSAGMRSPKDERGLVSDSFGGRSQGWSRLADAPSAGRCTWSHAEARVGPGNTQGGRPPRSPRISKIRVRRQGSEKEEWGSRERITKRDGRGPGEDRAGVLLTFVQRSSYMLSPPECFSSCPSLVTGKVPLQAKN